MQESLKRNINNASINKNEDQSIHAWANRYRHTSWLRKQEVYRHIYSNGAFRLRLKSRVHQRRPLIIFRGAC